jgi:Winged helix DNA-binding domain
VAPADIRWLLALTAPRVKALLAYYDRQLHIDAALLKRSRTVLGQALHGGQQLTRPELEQALRAAGMEQSGQDLGHIAMHAELDALICSGPRRGKQFTYMLLDERVPPAPTLTRDEALLELTQRYFTSHGPAQAQDFVWWSGLTAADAKKGLHLAGARLAHETLDGKDFWFAPSTPAPMPQTAYLLPNYDEYTIAYKDRSHFYDAAAFKSPIARDNVPFAHMIVMHGRIIGMWKRVLSSKAVVVETKVLQPLAAREQRALDAALKRYGEFLGLPVIAG